MRKICFSTKKRIFYTEEAIRLFIKGEPRKPRLFFYVCRECGWYHLTKTDMYRMLGLKGKDNA